LNNILFSSKTVFALLDRKFQRKLLARGNRFLMEESTTATRWGLPEKKYTRLANLRKKD